MREKYRDPTHKEKEGQRESKKNERDIVAISLFSRCLCVMSVIQSSIFFHTILTSAPVACTLARLIRVRHQLGR